jgi:sodium/bile acid cotransporter 7
MSISSLVGRLRPDGFTLALVGTVIVASLLPCSGAWALVLGVVTDVAIGLLFFLHGAKLSRDAILAGAGHWRLHLLVLGSTFLMFPLIGLAVSAAPAGGLIDPQVAMGVLYLCILPSTVQSSIAFTSMAGGNVPAAVCAASASNLLGIFLTPALAALLLNVQGAGGGGDFLGAVQAIVLQLLVPFLAGHFARPWIGSFVDRHKKALTLVDRGSILLVVYTAFSAAVIEGLWRRLGAHDLAVIVAVDCAILAVALFATTFVTRRLGFSRADEITAVFCGSKKSLASGVPMAGVLFPAAMVGPILLPLMVFHQIQLMVCAVLARHYAEKGA